MQDPMMAVIEKDVMQRVKGSLPDKCILVKPEWIVNSYRIGGEVQKFEEYLACQIYTS